MRDSRAANCAIGIYNSLNMVESVDKKIELALMGSNLFHITLSSKGQRGDSLLIYNTIG